MRSLEGSEDGQAGFAEPAVDCLDALEFFAREIDVDRIVFGAGLNQQRAGRQRPKIKSLAMRGFLLRGARSVSSSPFTKKSTGSASDFLQISPDKSRFVLLSDASYLIFVSL